MELSSSDITHQIDDFHGVEIYDPIPISNESHAVELLESQFQELFSATTGLTQPSKRATKDRGSTSSSSSQSQSQLFRKICMENVLADEVFQTSNVCSMYSAVIALPAILEPKSERISQSSNVPMRIARLYWNRNVPRITSF